MNKLYIHMGTPKTGTTALQFFLHNNMEILNSLGFDFPDISADFPDDKGFTKINNDESAYANGNFIIDSQVLSAYQQGPEAFNKILQYVFPDIAEYYRDVIDENGTDFDTLVNYINDKLKKNNVIISSENLWTFNYDFLERFIREFGDKVEVVVYLRRQDYYIESMWNEVIKLGVVSDTIEEYFGYMLYEENDNHGLRYKKRLVEISEIIGKEHLHVRIYGKQELKRYGGLYNDFLHAIGIEYDKYQWALPKNTINERISGPTVNIKRVFNEYLEMKVGSKSDILDMIPEHVGKYNKIFYRLSSSYTKTQTSKDYYFSSSDRMRMEKLFADDNAYIAQEFLGKAPGIPLFRDNNWTTERSVIPLSANEETILRMFYEVFYNEDLFNKYDKENS